MFETKPGDDIVDLRDVCEQYREVKAELLEREVPESVFESSESLGEFIETFDLAHDDYMILRAYVKLWGDLFESPEETAENEPILILDYYFTDYARQLADDIGVFSNVKEYGWPLNHIDWEAAADALKMDYSEVRWGGYTYFIRVY
jgi:antirestriction protein